MFGSLGGSEIVLILVIALIVFGPRKLPEIGKSVGRMLGEFRKASTDFKRTIEEEVEAEKLKNLMLDSMSVEATASPQPPATGAAPAADPAPPGAAPEQVAPPEGETVSRGASDPSGEPR